jgi:hypothetical protein
VPKKSWQNTLTAKEKVIANKLYEKVLDLKNSGGRTMCGTKDISRISSVYLTEGELLDEVRRLTHFSQEDSISLTLVQSPYDLHHLPADVILITCLLHARFIIHTQYR